MDNYIECDGCGLKINKKSLTRHKESKKCINASHSVKCLDCNGIVKLRNLEEHKKSELCINNHLTKEQISKRAYYYNNQDKIKEARNKIKICDICEKPVRQYEMKKHNREKHPSINI